MISISIRPVILKVGLDDIVSKRAFKVATKKVHVIVIVKMS
jgi:hypothetical protein